MAVVINEFEIVPAQASSTPPNGSTAPSTPPRSVSREVARINRLHAERLARVRAH
jgi:hypothetical protein